MSRFAIDEPAAESAAEPAAESAVESGWRRSRGAEIRLLAFVDPMMGLAWEMQPVYRRPEEQYPDLVIQPVMSVLVPDVYRLVDPLDLAVSKAQALKQYNRRLARIYLDEVPIAGMPMRMDGLRLFDEEHTSSRPLALAVKAVELANPELAASFLYRLRYALVVETRPVLAKAELVRVLRLVGADEDGVCEAISDGRAQAALHADLELGRRFGVQGLPAHVVLGPGSAAGSAWVAGRVQAARTAPASGGAGEPMQAAAVPGVAPFETFAQAIATLSGIAPEPARPTPQAVGKLVARRRLVCSVEIMAAFGLSDEEEARRLVAPLVEDGVVRVFEAAGRFFVELVD